MPRKTGKVSKPRKAVAVPRKRPHDADIPAGPLADDAIEAHAEVIGEELAPDSPVEAVAPLPVRDLELDEFAHDDAETDREVGDDARPIAFSGSDGAAPDGRLGADGGSLVPFDPLSRYLAEIRRFPLLSREEETVIAKRYAEFHEPDDAFRLVTANLRLVVKIANEFARATRNLLDLIQEGNIGLMEAVKHFNPEVGIRFPSYAVWWVRAYIYRYLINNWRLVKIGTTQAQRKLFFNLRKESERLEAEGFSAQPKLLAQRMGVKESEVREMQERMAQSEVSLDQPAGADDENTSLMDVLPDVSSNPEEVTAKAEWRDFAHEKVEQFARTLEGKELEIFRSRLLSEEPPTLQEVGVKFGISRERVRQIEGRLKRRFKAFLQAEGDDFGEAES